MEKFQLTVLFKIIGIGSASGLLYHNDLLYIISDNSTYLYEYNIANEKLNKIPLVENAQENIPKKDKPDFESITFYGDAIAILGSGSTKKRNLSFQYNIEADSVKQNDIADLYQKIKHQLNFSDDEFNIEGFIMNKKNLFLFQRGNGTEGKNGIISVYNSRNKSEIGFTIFNLPKIKNVPATFTDAILVDDKIYFLASAEDTTSTYLDGEVLGSIIGTIDLKTMKLENSIQISDKHKFEGLTLYKKTATQIELLLCEDNDTEELVSTIYKLVLKKQ
ncbi:DUF6929 family protein [Flavobacterium sangjuense]|uniref:Phytase-like domain-containing protein n=1 Tax=Flavobacterium sangjuense TaxID=2518177 RepID=A0A4P7PTZ4_9FLAO|nr:hypothetical protein [Flavobacterium sangjuense]QBZ98105.1 hypothetical protein GS03_01610 [Flavobacterium sangjuense]